MFHLPRFLQGSSSFVELAKDLNTSVKQGKHAAEFKLGTQDHQITEMKSLKLGLLTKGQIQSNGREQTEEFIFIVTLSLEPKVERMSYKGGYQMLKLVSAGNKVQFNLISQYPEENDIKRISNLNVYKGLLFMMIHDDVPKIRLQ